MIIVIHYNVAKEVYIHYYANRGTAEKGISEKGLCAKPERTHVRVFEGEELDMLPDGSLCSKEG